MLEWKKEFASFYRWNQKLKDVNSSTNLHLQSKLFASNSCLCFREYNWGVCVQNRIHPSRKQRKPIKLQPSMYQKTECKIILVYMGFTPKLLTFSFSVAVGEWGTSLYCCKSSHFFHFAPKTFSIRWPKLFYLLSWYLLSQRYNSQIYDWCALFSKCLGSSHYRFELINPAQFV